MEILKVADFTGGWLAGDFEPSLFREECFEVGVKFCPAGFTEPEHYQEVATEFTVVASGRVRVGTVEVSKGEICVIPPLEKADFEALTDAVLLVIKRPSLPADKRLD